LFKIKGFLSGVVLVTFNSILGNVMQIRLVVCVHRTLDHNSDKIMKKEVNKYIIAKTLPKNTPFVPAIHLLSLP